MSSSNLSIRLDPRTKAKLEALAKTSRRTKSFLAAEAIEAFVAAEGWQLDQMEAGLADLDARRAVDHEDVRKWLGSWGKKGERKAPR
jgi:predicted transcriptional regulator